MAACVPSPKLTIDDLFDVLDAATAAKNKWFNIGLALRVPLHVLTCLDEQYLNNFERCFREMLTEWLKNSKTTPCWEDLVEALRKHCVHLGEIANKIELEHCETTKQSTPRATSLPNSIEKSDQEEILIRVAKWVASSPLLETPSFLMEGQPSTGVNVTTETGSTTDTYRTADTTAVTDINPTGGFQSFSLEWTSGEAAIQKMYSPTPAVVHDNIAYFRTCKSELILTYDSTNTNWSTLISCVFEDTTMVIVRGVLTTVGGIEKVSQGKDIKRTNCLLSLTKDEEWEEKLPAMPTKRSQVTAVSTEETVIVAGGRDNSGPLQTVEVLNIDIKQWFKAAPLPKPLYRASGCISNGYLYILGGAKDKYKPVRYAFRALITELTDPNNLEIESPFCTMQKLPLTNCTCISIDKHVLAIGGLKSDSTQLKPTNSIYIFDASNDAWQEMVDSPMKRPRSRCFAVALSHTRLLVMGGYTIQADVGCTNTVEFAQLV